MNKRLHKFYLKHVKVKPRFKIIHYYSTKENSYLRIEEDYLDYNTYLQLGRRAGKSTIFKAQSAKLMIGEVSAKVYNVKVTEG